MVLDGLYMSLIGLAVVFIVLIFLLITINLLFRYMISLDDTMIDFIFLAMLQIIFILLELMHQIRYHLIERMRKYY